MKQQLTLYGIPNCDSVKKSMNWLKAQQVEFDFHDYKKLGIDKATLQRWSKQVGWEKLLNKKGTTWKKIAADHEALNLTMAKAIEMMLEHNSCIKRPVIEGEDQLIVGHDEDLLKSLTTK